MYETEQVDEDEAKKLAEDINAIFQKASAKSSNGIEDLFIKIGTKFLNPKSGDNVSTGKVNTPEKAKGKLNKKGNDGKQKKDVVKYYRIKYYLIVYF